MSPPPADSVPESEVRFGPQLQAFLKNALNDSKDFRLDNFLFSDGQTPAMDGQVGSDSLLRVDGYPENWVVFSGESGNDMLYPLYGNSLILPGTGTNTLSLSTETRGRIHFVDEPEQYNVLSLANIPFESLQVIQQPLLPLLPAPLPLPAIPVVESGSTSGFGHSSDDFSFGSGSASGSDSGSGQSQGQSVANTPEPSTELMTELTGQALLETGRNDRQAVRFENGGLNILNHDYAGGPITLAGWIKVDEDSPDSVIFQLSGDLNEGLISLEYSASHHQVTFLLHDSHSIQHQISGNGLLEPGQWVNLAASVDSNGNMKLIKNGAVVAKRTGAVPPSVNRTNCYLGWHLLHKHSLQEKAAFSGWIQDPVITSQALDARLFEQTMDGTTEDQWHLYHPESVLNVGLSNGVPDRLIFADKKVIEGQDNVSAFFQARAQSPAGGEYQYEVSVDLRELPTLHYGFGYLTVPTVPDCERNEGYIYHQLNFHESIDRDHILLERRGDNLLFHLVPMELNVAEVKWSDISDHLVIENYFNGDWPGVIDINSTPLSSAEIQLKLAEFPSHEEWVIRSDIGSLYFLRDAYNLRIIISETEIAYSITDSGDIELAPEILEFVIPNYFKIQSEGFSIPLRSVETEAMTPILPWYVFRFGDWVNPEVVNLTQEDIDQMAQITAVQWREAYSGALADGTDDEGEVRAKGGLVRHIINGQEIDKDTPHIRVGSNWGDSISLDQAQAVFGLRGEDEFTVQALSNTYLNGGDEFDTLHLTADSEDSIHINLEEGIISEEGQKKISLTSIESVHWDSPASGTITGSSAEGEQFTVDQGQVRIHSGTGNKSALLKGTSEVIYEVSESQKQTKTTIKLENDEQSKTSLRELKLPVPLSDQVDIRTIEPLSLEGQPMLEYVISYHEELTKAVHLSEPGDIASFTGVEVGGEMTLSLWAKVYGNASVVVPTESANELQITLWESKDGNNNLIALRYEQFIHPGFSEEWKYVYGRLVLHLSSESGEQSAIYHSNNMFPRGHKWQHFSLTISAQGEVHLYQYGIDYGGELISGSPFVPQRGVRATNNIFAESPVPIEIQSIYVFDTALSQSAITDLKDDPASKVLGITYGDERSEVTVINGVAAIIHFADGQQRVYEENSESESESESESGSGSGSGSGRSLVHDNEYCTLTRFGHDASRHLTDYLKQCREGVVEFKDDIAPERILFERREHDLVFHIIPDSIAPSEVKWSQIRDRLRLVDYFNDKQANVIKIGQQLFKGNSDKLAAFPAPLTWLNRGDLGEVRYLKNGNDLQLYIAEKDRLMPSSHLELAPGNGLLGLTVTDYFVSGDEVTVPVEARIPTRSLAASERSGDGYISVNPQELTLNRVQIAQMAHWTELHWKEYLKARDEERCEGYIPASTAHHATSLTDRHKSIIGGVARYADRTLTGGYLNNPYIALGSNLSEGDTLHIHKAIGVFALDGPDSLVLHELSGMYLDGGDQRDKVVFPDPFDGNTSINLNTQRIDLDGVNKVTMSSIEDVEWRNPGTATITGNNRHQKFTVSDGSVSIVSGGGDDQTELSGAAEVTYEWDTSINGNSEIVFHSEDNRPGKQLSVLKLPHAQAGDVQIIESIQPLPIPVQAHRTAGHNNKGREAMNFTGYNRHENFPEPLSYSNLTTGGDMTVALWFRTNRLDQKNIIWESKDSTGNHLIQLYLGKRRTFPSSIEGNYLRLKVSNENGQAQEWQSSQFIPTSERNGGFRPYSTNEWVHIAVTINTAGDVTFYRDGETVSSSCISASGYTRTVPCNPNIVPVVKQRDINQLNLKALFTTSQVEHLTILNRVLSLDEVREVKSLDTGVIHRLQVGDDQKTITLKNGLFQTLVSFDDTEQSQEIFLQKNNPSITTEPALTSESPTDTGIPVTTASLRRGRSVEASSEPLTASHTIESEHTSELITYGMGHRVVMGGQLQPREFTIEQVPEDHLFLFRKGDDLQVLLIDESIDDQQWNLTGVEDRLTIVNFFSTHTANVLIHGGELLSDQIIADQSENLSIALSWINRHKLKDLIMIQKGDDLLVLFEDQFSRETSSLDDLIQIRIPHYFSEESPPPLFTKHMKAPLERNMVKGICHVTEQRLRPLLGEASDVLLVNARQALLATQGISRYGNAAKKGVSEQFYSIGDSRDNTIPFDQGVALGLAGKDKLELTAFNNSACSGGADHDQLVVSAQNDQGLVTLDIASAELRQGSDIKVLFDSIEEFVWNSSNDAEVLGSRDDDTIRILDGNVSVRGEKGDDLITVVSQQETRLKFGYGDGADLVTTGDKLDEHGHVAGTGRNNIVVFDDDVESIRYSKDEQKTLLELVKDGELSGDSIQLTGNDDSFSYQTAAGQQLILNDLNYLVQASAGFTDAARESVTPTSRTTRDPGLTMPIFTHTTS